MTRGIMSSMPKIAAASVAEHREMRRDALVSVAAVAVGAKAATPTSSPAPSAAAELAAITRCLITRPRLAAPVPNT